MILDEWKKEILPANKREKSRKKTKHLAFIRVYSRENKTSNFNNQNDLNSKTKY